MKKEYLMWALGLVVAWKLYLSFFKGVSLFSNVWAAPAAKA